MAVLRHLLGTCSFIFLGSLIYFYSVEVLKGYRVTFPPCCIVSAVVAVQI
jgi:hypothetical protein